ncbi:MAG: hypothetical protein EOO01_24305, partial [Chitinophagaceae bacterium]
MRQTLSKKTIELANEAIVQVVGHYVNLRKRGASYKGCCPFHQERTPSFHVHPAKGIFKCFGCGVKGDAIQFIMDYEKKSFSEAVEVIAGMAGFPIETEEGIIQSTWMVPKPQKKLFQPLPFDTIPLTFLDESEDGVLANPLTAQTAAIVGENIVKETVREYKISIDGNWITFTQIDVHGRYRTGKSICRESSGARTKRFKWVHDELKRKGLLPETFCLKQCFTGEHLLTKYPNKPVAIVEGQSTMLFMAALGKVALKYNISELKYFSSFLWLSTGGSDGIGWKDEQVLKVLTGRNVILFPDAGFYEKWSEDAKAMQDLNIKVRVSHFLESMYERGQLNYNDDLRDYFLQYRNEIAEKCYNASTEIEIKSMLPSSIVMKTGEEYGNLISASFFLKDGRFVDVLFDQSGELILYHPC